MGYNISVQFKRYDRHDKSIIRTLCIVGTQQLHYHCD